MATVAHHVYSYYTPEDRQRLEVETGQLDVETDVADDPWAIEKPFGSSRRITHPPMFIPATLNYDEWAEISDAGKGVALEGSRRGGGDEGEGEGKVGVADWYRSLQRKTPSGTPGSNTPVTGTLTPNKDHPRTKGPIKRDRNNWFISRALEASSPNLSETSRSTSPTTLADILARDPPPLPSQEKYTPPVWLAIGPSNKGFAMLQKSGWEEGEALGRASRHRAGLGYSGKGKEREVGRDEEVERADVVVKQEVIDDISMDKEIIDLTGEDSETDSISEDVFTHPPSPPPLSPPEPSQNFELEPAKDLDHAPRALLTPLPTVLKSDRLGIGLKAKTVGSGLYRAPVKRVTHSQAAVAAHIRANEERRRLKEKVGRGRRGYERIKKREEEGRRNLLDYLNR